jgi:hypothetical protein
MSLKTKRFILDKSGQNLDEIQSFFRRESIDSSQIVLARTLQISQGMAIFILIYEDTPTTTPTSSEIIANCDVSLEVSDWVAIGTTDNEVVLADASSADTPAIGVITEKPTTTTAKVMISGEFDGFSGLTPRDRIFLSTVAGEHVINQDFAPVPYGYKLVQRLGVAKSSTSVIVAPGPIFEIE